MMRVVTVPPRAIYCRDLSTFSIAPEVDAPDRRVRRVAIEEDTHEGRVGASRRRLGERHGEAPVRFPLRVARACDAPVLGDEEVTGDRPDRRGVAQRLALQRLAHDAAVALLLDRELDVGRDEDAVAGALDAGDQRAGRMG